MNISHILSQLIEKNMTQVEIASELECSQPTVSEMLNGKLGNSRPSYKMVQAIERVAKKHGVKISRAERSTA